MELFKTEAPNAVNAVEWKQINLMDIKAVDKLAKTLSQITRLDCIWCNAGVGTGPKMESPDGLDGHFTLNHLSHYILLNHLLPVVRKTAKEHGEARVVFTSSSLHSSAPGNIHFESKEEMNEDIGPNNLYARSKLANLLYSRQLAKKVENENVFINAIHPGAVKTGMSFVTRLMSEQNYQLGDPGAYGVAGSILINTIRPFFKDAIEEGCLSALFAGTSPRIVEENIRGEYIYPPDEITNSSDQAKDKELGQKLTTLSDRLVKEILV
jgi:NAD(P)-dependent dehydrogenase (short-subunit alcohol dehydrogenase family)